MDESPAGDSEAAAHRWRRGGERPLERPRSLVAGALSAELDGAQLRYIRWHGLELVRRLAVIVRDGDWRTVPAELHDVRVRETPDAFAVTLDVRHLGEGVDFRWTGELCATSAGTVGLAMDGTAAADSLANRIGICVLHPPAQVAGSAFTGRAADGGVIEGRMPDRIGPQRLRDGVPIGLFEPVTELELDLTDGDVMHLRFTGDAFETEDQRNWGDASLKTYGPPLGDGRPRRMSRGEGCRQAVSLTIRRGTGVRRGTAAPTPRDDSAPDSAVMAPIGVTLAAESAPTPGHLSRLALVRPGHLRHELRLLDAAWPQGLARASRIARAAGAHIELALLVPEHPSTARLARLAHSLEKGVPLARVLVSVDGARTASPQETTPAATAYAVRRALGGLGAPIAVGTALDFCELNRSRPAFASADGVFWSVDPQVHAADDVSLMETPDGLRAQVHSARAFSCGRPLFIGPLTLGRRDGEPDRRQTSMLGAAWTLASVSALATAGAGSLTCLEAFGPRGIIVDDDPAGAPSGSQWLAVAHVIADAAELRGRRVHALRRGDPLQVAGLVACAEDGEPVVLLANLGAMRRRIDLLDFGVSEIGSTAAVRRLNAETAAWASAEPVAFRRAVVRADVRRLELFPYETVRISRAV